MRTWKYTFTLLFLILAAILLALSQVPDKNLHIIACDVGQGDAILISYGTTQILTDGGPDPSVLTCLGRHMPFWDRQIELVISTHPDADHSTGLTNVLESYKVDKILINPMDPGTNIYQVLKNSVGGRGIGVINPVSGQTLGLGLIYLDILNPTGQMLDSLPVINDGDKLVKYSVKAKTNLYSIAYKLSFKMFTGLFLGDIPPEISDSLAGTGSIGRVQYIKIPHHGSVNGITESLINTVKPKVAVISVGKNPWGLPSEEILNMLNKYEVRILRTDKMGDIDFVTDGEKYWLK